MPIVNGKMGKNSNINKKTNFIGTEKLYLNWFQTWTVKKFS